VEKSSFLKIDFKEFPMDEFGASNDPYYPFGVKFTEVNYC